MSSILPTVYNVRKWPVYHELTVWSRGIIMDKEARDVSSCIAAAARALGYYADNVSDYVDDPDRTNCLVRRYARFGDFPIVAAWSSSIPCVTPTTCSSSCPTI